MFRPVINVATESPGDFMSLITVIPLSPHKYCPLLVIKSEAHELVSLIKLSDLSRGVIFHSLPAPVFFFAFYKSARGAIVYVQCT